QTLGISDIGTSSYAWNAAIVYQTGNGWLKLNGAGSAGGTSLPGSLVASVVPISTQGTLSALIRLTGNGHTLDVPVSYTVTLPSPRFSPASAAFTIDAATVPADLSKTFTIGSTGGPFSWTATPSQPWVKISPTSGASGASVAVSIDLAEVDRLDTGAYSARIDFSHAGGTTALPVSLNLLLPKVRSVNPYVAASNTSLEVILRGLGFNNAAGAAVKFGDTPVTSYTVVSDTEIHVTHPSLTAGSYRVSIANPLNTSGLVLSSADLVVVDAPAYAATTI